MKTTENIDVSVVFVFCPNSFTRIKTHL
jgi:hypothetical protein